MQFNEDVRNFYRTGLGIDRSQSIATSSSTILVARPDRTRILFKNDAANNIWINLDGPAVAVAGGGNYKIAAGAYFELLRYNGAVQAIAETGATLVTIREF